jgi:Peptidase inhibitor family I36
MKEFPAMNFLRLPALAGTAALAATVGVLGMTAPASASTKDGICQTGEFCLYSQPNAGGLVFDTTGGDSNMTNERFPRNQSFLVTPNVRSAFNKTQKPWGAYSGVDFTVAVACVKPGQFINLRAGFQVRSVASGKSCT